MSAAAIAAVAAAAIVVAVKAEPVAAAAAQQDKDDDEPSAVTVTHGMEMRGVEPLSESHLPTLSTSVAGILNLPQHSAYRQALRFGSP